MFKPDNTPTYLVLKPYEKMTTMKKLKKAVMVSVASVFILGAYVNFKEECILKPSGEFNIHLSVSEKAQKGERNNYVAYSTFIYLFYDTGTSWTVPADWNNSDNKIECIGGGGSGGYRVGSMASGGAGGGGGYAYVTNATLTIGSSVSYKAGDFVLGAGSGSSSSGVNGNFSNFGAICRANGGSAGTSTTGGAGGAFVTGAGGFSGGTGANGSTNSLVTNRGGGAAGPHGAGVNAGAGDAGFGGAVGSTNGAEGGRGTNLGNGGGGSGGGGGAQGGDGGLWGGGGGGGQQDTLHSPTALYNGGSGREGLVVISYTPVVSTTTVVTSSVNPSSVNTPVTFTATITSNAASVTGNVSFKDNGTIIGNSAVVSGVATYTTSNLAIGTHPINATYNGDSNNLSSNSSSISQVVRYVGSPFKIFINYG